MSKDDDKFLKKMTQSEKQTYLELFFKELKLHLSTNGCRICLDIMTGKNCHKFRLLTLNSFIGQFVHPVGGEGMG